MRIRNCQLQDAQQICDIYNFYVENTTITFEEVPVSVEEMARRIDAYTKLCAWFVCEVDGVLVGYAYATKWKERSAYKLTVETTVYIRNNLSGKGYGKALYTALLESLRIQKFHVALGCLALPNEPSAKLHEFFGFEKVAHYAEVGRKFNRWVDVGYWQKILED